METKETARELLVEVDTCKNSMAMLLGACLMQNEKAILERNAFVERRAIAVAKLDLKCKAAGISIINGRFVQNYALLNVDHTPHGSTCWLDLPAREQQAIQEWILIKNEEKTA